MKRVPISMQEFLRDLLSRTSLTWEEQSTLERVLQGPRPRELDQTARSLIDGLVDRGVLAVLERQSDGEHEWLRLRDPERKIRFRICLPKRREDAPLQRIPLPLDPTSRAGLRYHEVQELLALQGSLISYDRVMSPRELASRLPSMLRELIPASSAAFHALDIPVGENWPQVPWKGFPTSQEEIEAMTRQRDHLLLWPDLGRQGSLLLIGLGDEGVGWRGLLALHHPEREHFTMERIALAALVSQHFRNLLTTTIRLQGLIFYDFLTGIYNRSYFEEQLEREIQLARRRGQAMALLIVDIDGFKSFNTRYGYDGGDRVLATVAAVLKSALRGTDTLARYGGEEFAIILAPPVPREEARRIAERLRAAVEEEPFQMKELNGDVLRARVTVSVGGVLYPEGGRTPRDLWNTANRLLLEAKMQGKNRVCFAGDPPEESFIESVPDAPAG